MTAAAAAYIGLVLARVGAFAAVAPPFSGQTPRMVRVGLAIALTAFYVGAVGPAWDAALANHAGEVDSVRYGIALIREALIGTAMGFAFGLFMLPARVAGEFITQQVGLNVAPQTGPTGTDAAGPVTRLFETAAALLFLITDTHHVAIATLHASFTSLPLGGTTMPAAGAMANGLAAGYEMGVLLAGPLAMCLFLLAITLAVMARAAPQLNVYSVGFAFQVLVVLVGGLFLLPEMIGTLNAIIARTGQNLPLMLGG